MTNLYNECGGHRIQRVPPTERKGRVHTSTVTVAITDPSIPVIEIKDSDLKIEWYSGTGAGGQFRNKHQNSCRLTHIPTGTMVTAQCRSRENSYEQAFNDLKKRVDEQLKSTYNASKSNERKEQVGSGMRGDKIRTYRFQDDSVTDHVLNTSALCSKVMKGEIDRLWK